MQDQSQTRDPAHPNLTSQMPSSPGRNPMTWFPSVHFGGAINERLQPHLAVDSLIGWRQSDQTKHTSYLPLYYCARPLQPRTLHPEGVCARERDITSLLPTSHLITCLCQRASLFPDSPPHPLVKARAPKPRCPLTPDWHASQNTPTPHHRLASFPPCWAGSCTVTACSC